MAKIMNFAYKGRGQIWVGPDRTDLRSLGNVSNAELSFTTEEQTLPDYRGCAGGQYASALEVDEANFSLTLHDLSPENVALAFYGTTGTVAEGPAPEETHTVPTIDRRLIQTDAVIKAGDAVVVSSSPGGAGTVYEEGSDYNVYPAGIQYLHGGNNSLAGGETVYVTYTIREVTTVEALMTSSIETLMIIDGLNCAQSGAPVTVEIWRAKPAPAEAFQLIQDEFASFTLTGKMDADPSKGSNESEYFKVHVATTI